jgi:hypothetical protein
LAESSPPPGAVATPSATVVWRRRACGGDNEKRFREEGSSLRRQAALALTSRRLVHNLPVLHRIIFRLGFAVHHDWCSCGAREQWLTQRRWERKELSATMHGILGRPTTYSSKFTDRPVKHGSSGLACVKPSEGYGPAEGHLAARQRRSVAVSCLALAEPNVPISHTAS